jgi:hypothetical protein
VETSAAAAGSRFEIEYEYTEALARRAFFALLWRHRTAHVLVSPLLLLWALFEAFSPVYGFLAGVAVGAVAFTWASWWASSRIARRTARTPDGPPRIRILLAETMCTFEMRHMRIDLAWPGIQRVERLRDFLLLYRPFRESVSIIPLAAIAPEAQDFLLRKVQEAGGRVR